MLTNDDIVKLSAVLATKEDIKDLRSDISELRESIKPIPDLIRDLKLLRLSYTTVLCDRQKA